MSKYERDSLGTRMKGYETCFRPSLPRRSCVIVRVDGRAFHSYTKGFNRPFDDRIIDAMLYAACEVAKDMQGFKLAYHQSDEVSFLMHDYETINTEAWFANDLTKIVSLTASRMAVKFNRKMQELLTTSMLEALPSGKTDAVAKLLARDAEFDSRAFLVPQADVTNYFLWRAKDWQRNSLSMYARQYYSAKALHGKARSDQHELLFQKGKNWTLDLPPRLRNGTFILNATKSQSQSPKTKLKSDPKFTFLHPLPQYPAVAGVVDPLLCPKEEV